MQLDLRKLQTQCWHRVSANTILNQISIILRILDIEARLLHGTEIENDHIPDICFMQRPFSFLLTKFGFMNKLIEDMERHRTKRVPDRFIQREGAAG